MRSREDERRGGVEDNLPLGALAHPLTLLALVFWVLNDHVFKDAYGNGVTGKLSDVLGLIVFPIVVAAVVSRRVHRRIEIGIGTTLILFGSINLLAPADEAAEAVLGVFFPNSALTPDPTDLLALPAVLVALWLWRHPVSVRGRWSRVLGRAVFASAVVATMATSPADEVSGPMISRVEATDDGFFALHQRLLLYSDGLSVEDGETVQSDRGKERGLPLDNAYGELPGGYQVYWSADGREWELTEEVAAEIEWPRAASGCVAQLCVDLSRSAGGLIRLETGGVAFEPLEEPPGCLDAKIAAVTPGCDFHSSPGPHDVAVSPDGETMVVAMGTEGVARYSDGDWSQVNVATLRPRSWRRRHIGAIVLATVIAGLLVIAVPLFLKKRWDDRRYRAQFEH